MARRTLTAVGLCAALAAGALVPAAAAASPAAPVDRRAAAGAAAPAASPKADRTAAPVTRLIVRMADRGPVPAAVTAAVARGAGVERAAAARRLVGGAQLVMLSAPVSLAAAQGIARSLVARPDVAWAEPDVLLAPADVAPVVPDDPRFADQWALWDAAGVEGGYSTRAPVAWQRTTGSRDVVVAVVDTGITKHPDLDPNVVPGYDFVSLDDVAPYAGTNLAPLTANDGNGRDADPTDPGTWITAAEDDQLGFFRDLPCTQTSSSWHGTHVAGIVAAAQGNGTGISGVAPGVRIQPVRAVGKCSGYLSDIADGIRWAAGGSVPSVPANATPADVINLSLGGSGSCAASYLQDAITYAVGAGATVIAAAGNENSPVAGNGTDPGTLPANCDGVIAVAATDRQGLKAPYSNYGPEVDLAAPGGVAGVGTGILSTVNAGLTSPTAPAYGSLAGTSMAAPHVAGAAALLQSTRVGREPLTPAEVAAELRALTRAFVDGDACTNEVCGSGILDLGAGLPDVAPLPVPSGDAAPLEGSADLTWEPTPDAGAVGPVTYVVSYDQLGTTQTVETTGTSSLISGLDNGTPYTFSVTARNSAGLTSDPAVIGTATPVAPADAVPTRPTGLASTPRVLGMTVTWAAAVVPDGAAPIDGYEVEYRSAGGEVWTNAAAATTTWQLDGIENAAYEVRVRAFNSVGAGPWSSVRSVTVLPRRTTITTTGSTVRPFVDGFQDSIGITVTSNAPFTALDLSPGTDPASPAVRTWKPAGAGPWTFAFTGRDSAGKRLAAGTYTLRVRQRNPLTGAFDISAARTVSVRTSQVAAPAIGLSAPSVHWYVDGYRDVMTITVPTSVPATQTWRLTNSTGTYTYRTWRFDRALSASRRWTGWGTSSRLRDGTYYLRVTATGGEGTARTTVTKVVVSSDRLQKARFTRTVYPGSVAVKGLNPAAGAPRLVDARFDGITRKVLYVRGGYSPATGTGTYDVLSLSAALPSSVVRHTGVKVSTCLRAPVAGWSPKGTNVLGGGYMSSSTRFAGWFAALLDESQEGQFALEPDYIACLRPELTTPSAAMANGRIRWSLFNWAASPDAYVPVYSFTITGYRYYLS